MAGNVGHLLVVVVWLLDFQSRLLKGYSFSAAIEIDYLKTTFVAGAKSASADFLWLHLF